MSDRVLETLHRALSRLLVLLVGLMLLPVTLQIVTRYTPFLPPQMWTEEVARFCLVWTILLGAAVGVRERAHFDIDLLPQPRTDRSRAAGLLVVDLAALGFMAAFLWSGVEVFREGRQEVSEMTEISMGWLYVVFPLSAACSLAFLAGHIARDLRMLAGGSPDPLALAREA